MTVPRKSPLAKLMLGATRVVFGDIGTSPLSAFRESFVPIRYFNLPATRVVEVGSRMNI